MPVKIVPPGSQIGPDTVNPIVTTELTALIEAAAATAAAEAVAAAGAGNTTVTVTGGIPTLTY